MEIALKQKTQTPASPKRFNPHVPDSLGQAVLKCLEKKEKRFESALALHAELDRIDNALRLTANTRAKKTPTRTIAPAIRRGLRPLVLVLASWSWRGLVRPIGRTPGPQLRQLRYTRGLGPLPGPFLLKEPIEFVLDRALSAATRKYVFVQKDLLIYKKRTESAAAAFRPAG